MADTTFSDAVASIPTGRWEQWQRDNAEAQQAKQAEYNLAGHLRRVTRYPEGPHTTIVGGRYPSTHSSRCCSPDSIVASAIRTMLREEYGTEYVGKHCLITDRPRTCNVFLYWPIAE